MSFHLKSSIKIRDVKQLFHSDIIKWTELYFRRCVNNHVVRRILLDQHWCSNSLHSKYVLLHNRLELQIRSDETIQLPLFYSVSAQ